MYLRVPGTEPGEAIDAAQNWGSCVDTDIRTDIRTKTVCSRCSAATGATKYIMQKHGRARTHAHMHACIHPFTFTFDIAEVRALANEIADRPIARLLHGAVLRNWKDGRLPARMP